MLFFQTMAFSTSFRGEILSLNNAGTKCAVAMSNCFGSAFLAPRPHGSCDDASTISTNIPTVFALISTTLQEHLACHTRTGDTLHLRERYNDA
jgi:hypothetical protein